MVYIQYLLKETLSGNSGYKRVLLYRYDELSVRKRFYDAFIDKLKKSSGYKESAAAGKIKASYAEFKNW